MIKRWFGKRTIILDVKFCDQCDALREDYEGLNYEIPDSESEISSISCGGCG